MSKRAPEPDDCRRPLKSPSRAGSRRSRKYNCDMSINEKERLYNIPRSHIQSVISHPSNALNNLGSLRVELRSVAVMRLLLTVF